MSAFAANNRGGTTTALNTAIDAYVALLRPLFTNATQFVGATLWRYAPSSYVRTFYSTYDINLAGSASGSNLVAGQAVYTYRTLIGNRMRVNLMEGISNGTQKLPQNTLTLANLAFANYFVGASCVFHGRDNAFAAVGLNYLAGQNEALFRKRYRI